MREISGGISAFLVVLLPALIVLGGVAVDVSHINGQKRDTQALSDLAALAAAPLLPDRAAAEARARLLIAEARPCAAGANCADRPRPQITFLVRNAAGELVPSADPTQRAAALRVETAVDYRPILMGAVMSNEDLAVRRSATAEKTGLAHGFAAFTLRNQLLSINTRDSILDHILSPLGIALTVDALGSDGLANANVKLDRLLYLASAGLAVGVATFNDVLNVPVSLRDLLGVALKDGSGANLKGYFTRGPAADKKVTLGEILDMSPQLLNLKVGDVLPDIELNVLDLLKVMANLGAAQNQRLGLGIDLVLIDSRLGGASIGLGLIRSHSSGIAAVGDEPRPHAVLRQTDLNLTVGLLSLIRLDLILGVAGVEAELASLNCYAREGTDDILAAFDLWTYPLSAYLSIQILNQNASLDATIEPGKDAARLLASPDPHRVNFSRKEFEDGKRKKDVRGTVSISNLGGELQKLLKNIKIGPDTSEKGRCGWNILNCIIEALTGLTARLVGLVLDVVNLVIPLDRVVNALLSTLGIDVAGANITLDQVNCTGETVGPSRLIG